MISKVVINHKPECSAFGFLFISHMCVLFLGKYVHMGLTKTVQSAILWLSKKSESIEVRYTSVQWPYGAGSPVAGKGLSPKLRLIPGQL